ncbi:MAG: DUF4177 domain-containing protein [Actinobacteria bacterium]|nr:DUF4177 domain-containing protein [Actinomycetota bacterium]
MAQYKVEFLPADLVVKTGETQAAASTIESILNKYASQGWQLVQIGQVSVTEKGGCFFGGKPQTFSYNMVVFVK